MKWKCHVKFHAANVLEPRQAKFWIIEPTGVNYSEDARARQAARRYIAYGPN